MKNKINLIRLFVTLVFGICLFYFQLPALNLKDPSLYVFVFSILICYLITSALTLIDITNVITNVKKVPRRIT